MYAAAYTWMRVPTPVMMRIITDESGSRAKSKPKSTEPMRTISHAWQKRNRCASGSASSLATCQSDSAKAASIAPTATRVTPRLPMCSLCARS